MLMAESNTYYVVEAEPTTDDGKTFSLTYHPVFMWVQDRESNEVYPVVMAVNGLVTINCFDGYHGWLWLGSCKDRQVDQPYIDAEARDYAARTQRQWVQQ